MIDIETKNLRETFYKFFFTGYKAFVTGNMKFGVYIPEDTIEKYAYENPYNIILMKYGLISKNGKLEIKGETVKPYLGLSNNLRFSDEQLANSADCFFKICSTVSAKNHIYNLLSYNIEGGTKKDGRNILVEDELLRLILNYFWDKYGKALWVEVNRTRKEFNRDDFMAKANDGTFHYSDVIHATRELLTINKNKESYKKIENFLLCVKDFRNSEAHPDEKRRLFDYYDATIINRFTLYTFLTTVLYLQMLLPENEQYPVDLHVICNDAVILNEDNNDITGTGRKEIGGWIFPIKRYHKYKISIPGKFEKEFEPMWFSQSPTVFYMETWDYVDNEFEMDCILKNATYATIQEMNTINHDLLSGINGTVSKMDEKLESIDKSSNEQVKKLEKLEDINNSVQDVATSINELIAKLDELITSNIQGKSNAEDEAKAMNSLVVEYKKINEGSEKSIIRSVNRNRYLIIALYSIIIAFLIFIVYLFIGHKKSAEEYVAEGNSFLIAGDSLAAEKAYKDAIDAFNNRIGSNAEEMIKLASHYLNIGNTEIAYRLILPLTSDMKEHPDAVIAAAEIMFEKKDYHGVKTMINAYKSVVNDSTPAIDCLEGLLYFKGTEAGYPKNYKRGKELIVRAFDAGYIRANYWVGRFLTEDITQWDPIPDRDNNSNIDMLPVDITTGVECLRRAAPTILKAALKLGQVYADLNMTDSAEYYLNKVMLSSEEGMELYNHAKFGLALLYEKKGEKENSYMQSLLITKYKDAMLHDALKGDNPEAIVGIYSTVDYSGHRYLSPKALAHLALGEKEKALQVLVSQHKDGGFTMDFVDGLEKLLGTKYAYQDSLKGMQLMRLAADAGCDYARMLCLYRDIEHRLLDKNQIEVMDVISLENLGKKIPFAYALASYMFSEANIISRAQWAALKAMGSNHPAGALAVTATYSKYTPSYFERIWKDEGECAKFYNTIQVALMESPYKEKCIELSCFTDKAKYDLHKESYPQWRLEFWTDVAIANHFTIFEYFMLNAWNQRDKSNPIVKINKKKLSRAILTGLDLNKIDDQQLESLKSALNDLTDSEIDSLREQFKGKINALSVIDGRMHYKPQKTYNGYNTIIKLKLPILIDSILFEFSDIIEKDKFSTYFETINSQEK